MHTTLLFSLFLCHWLADFSPLSTAWMLKAKEKGSPLFPIFVHACVHGGLMSIVFVLINPISDPVWLLPILFQITSHFLIDVLKGKLGVWFPTLADSSNKWHWFVFGMDQFLHTITILYMVVLWDSSTVCGKF